MERLLSPDEVAELLSVSPVTVTYWLRNKIVKGIKVGNQWRIDQRDLEGIEIHLDMIKEPLLTPEEVARVLSVSPISVRRWLGLGTIKGTKIAGSWRIYPQDLEEYVEKKREAFIGA